MPQQLAVAASRMPFLLFLLARAESFECLGFLVSGAAALFLFLPPMVPGVSGAQQRRLQCMCGRCRGCWLAMHV